MVVIGAGAAGLVAARKLGKGHKVIVFKRGDQLGGTWVYNPNVESDPIRDFAEEFGISNIVRLETKVVLVDVAANKKWKVKSRSKGGGDVEDEIYDAVVMCCGHHTEPHLSQIQGMMGGLQLSVGVQALKNGENKCKVAALENMHKQPETYWDELEDHHLVLQAHQDFINYILTGVRIVDK
ncbi:hypothetical protein C1H46_000341 [Malus baccata]|uniref:FAD/NAD(P)-binding domain-containing protein n=1 Tax=Malus baccata TaxID=106549 RepID=A0A540NSR0_MALBA|nr:hypothetical protein C1H46_000341 [Malus baccata]